MKDKKLKKYLLIFFNQMKYRGESVHIELKLIATLSIYEC